uniref:Uncharacterized protein n=1 Tax=Octopus bimaculoides TaxID=37653 RepID=A0A0L8HQT8_OCTBM
MITRTATLLKILSLAHTHKCKHTYTQTQTHIHTNTNTHTHKHKHTYTQIQTHIHSIPLINNTQVFHLLNSPLIYELLLWTIYLKIQMFGGTMQPKQVRGCLKASHKYERENS